MKGLLSAAAIAVTFALFVPYIRLIHAGRIRPHVFSWVIWGLGTFTVFVAQLTDGAGAGAWPIGVSGLVTFYIAALSYRNRADTAITRTDRLYFAAALAAFPLWLVTADAAAAVILLTAADLIGFGPTARRGWRHPDQESAGFFALGAVRNLLVVLALEHYSLTTALFPAAVGVGCLLLAGMLVWRRRVLAGRPADLAAPPPQPESRGSDSTTTVGGAPSASG